MRLPRKILDGMVKHFTTDPAVRAGVLQAAWAVAPSYARGLLPRNAMQQSVATGATTAAYYVIGANTWAAVSSVSAGVPGSRPGPRARLVAATVAAAGGKTAEIALRPRSGDSFALGAVWTQARFISVAGLAGGLVTAADLVAHDVLNLPRTPWTTLALDVGLGGAMAAGTIVRRQRRARKYREGQPEHAAVSGSRGKNAANVAVIGVGTTTLLSILAVAEQAGARASADLLNKAVGSDLGEFADYAGHTVMLAGATGIGLLALRQVRSITEERADAEEAAYEDPPTSVHVSTGPASEVDFDDIGKEGRRFVIMTLDSHEIADVMHEPAVDPVRVVIGRQGEIAERAAMAVRELRALGGFDRSLICVASPTGVGYVNYIVAEALEYLTRGNCAIVDPQYALVPSALALNRTDEGVELQRAVIHAIAHEIAEMEPRRRPRLMNFGESLGAEVALDTGEPEGPDTFDKLGVESGLYLGVPFRSSLWRRFSLDPENLSHGGRMVEVPQASQVGPGRGRHVMVIHNDDPINKFAYTMFVRRPTWMGPPRTRPPGVPRETLFRPITTFILTVVDLLNGMNSKPGEFRMVGHDYRIDARQALEYTFDLPCTPEQAAEIEQALRQREQDWAQKRLVANAAAEAVAKISAKLNKWGHSTAEMELMDPAETTASQAVASFLSQRMGSGAADIEESDAEGGVDADTAGIDTAGIGTTGALSGASD